MNDFKNGTYELIYIYVDGQYYPIGCLTSNSFEESVDMLETTTRENAGGWDTSIPTTQSFSISINGLATTNDRDGAILTYDDIMRLKRDKTRISWKINSELTGYSDFGLGYITSISKNSEIDSFIDFSAEIRGYAQPVRLEDEDNSLNYNLNADL